MKKTILLITAILMMAVMSACDSGLSRGQDTSNLIGEERAKEIALEKAGITKDEVIFDRIELDRDNGAWHYEVEFRKERTEYDVDVKADDGMIIAYETDLID